MSVHVRCVPLTPVLSWLSFTVTLSALAAGLLNFGDRVGRVSAALFSLVAVAIIASLIVVNQGLTTVFTTITTALARPAP